MTILEFLQTFSNSQRNSGYAYRIICNREWDTWMSSAPSNVAILQYTNGSPFAIDGWYALGYIDNGPDDKVLNFRPHAQAAYSHATRAREVAAQILNT